MIRHDGDAIGHMLEELVDEYQRDKAGRCLDVDTELARLAKLFPSEVAPRAAELRAELARVAAAHLIPIKMG